MNDVVEVGVHQLGHDVTSFHSSAPPGAARCRAGPAHCVPKWRRILLPTNAAIDGVLEGLQDLLDRHQLVRVHVAPEPPVAPCPTALRRRSLASSQSACHRWCTAFTVGEFVLLLLEVLVSSAAADIAYSGARRRVRRVRLLRRRQRERQMSGFPGWRCMPATDEAHT